MEEDWIPYVQTLLYSLLRTTKTTQSSFMMNKNKTKNVKQGEEKEDDDGYYYPPEVVVLIDKHYQRRQTTDTTTTVSTKSSNPSSSSSSSSTTISEGVRQLYNSRLCTRIITVEEWNTTKTTTSPRQPGDDDNECCCCWWNLVNVFGLQQYNVVVFLKPDCLVLKDIAPHLLDNFIVTPAGSPSGLAVPTGNGGDESPSCLVAVAPKQQPLLSSITSATTTKEDKDDDDDKESLFDIGVMVLRPKRGIMDDMRRAYNHRQQQQQQGLTAENFLNRYFAESFTRLSSSARLDVGYNASQELYHRHMDYWKTKIEPNLHIIRYSSSNNVDVKPWEQATLDSDANADADDGLHPLYRTWYQDAVAYIQHQAQKKKQRLRDRQSKEMERQRSQQQQEQKQQQQRSNDPQRIHKAVTRRYKELRKEGKSAQVAMKQAREEFGDDDDGNQPCNSSSSSNIDPGRQVAAMFGIQ
jgi:hypothetical protein